MVQKKKYNETTLIDDIQKLSIKMNSTSQYRDDRRMALRKEWEDDFAKYEKNLGKENQYVIKCRDCILPYILSTGKTWRMLLKKELSTVVVQITVMYQSEKEFYMGKSKEFKKVYKNLKSSGIKFRCLRTVISDVQIFFDNYLREETVDKIRITPPFYESHSEILSGLEAHRPLHRIAMAVGMVCEYVATLLTHVFKPKKGGNDLYNLIIKAVYQVKNMAATDNASSLKTNKRNLTRAKENNSEIEHLFYCYFFGESNSEKCIDESTGFKITFLYGDEVWRHLYGNNYMAIKDMIQYVFDTTMKEYLNRPKYVETKMKYVNEILNNSSNERKVEHITSRFSQLSVEDQEKVRKFVNNV
jgi:hypothetical protein